MNDREFDEIMHKYVESTKLDKDIAFKKLKNNSDKCASVLWVSTPPTF